MTLTAYSVQCALNQDGELDLGNVDGSGNADEGTWDVIPAINFTEGSADTVDLADYYSLSGATYALIVNGNVPGVTLSSSVLTYDGVGSTGFGNFTVSATVGFTAVETTFSAQVLEAAVSEDASLILLAWPSSGTITKPPYTISKSSPAIVTVDNTHVRESAYPNTLYCEVARMSGVNESYRAEVSFRDVTDILQAAGSETLWVGTSIYIPTSSRNKEYYAIFQDHCRASLFPINDTSPGIGLRHFGTTGIIQYDTEVGERTGHDTDAVLNSSTPFYDQWLDIVWAIKYRTDPTGRMRLFINPTATSNRTPVKEYNNIITNNRNDTTLPFWKIGLYPSLWKAAFTGGSSADALGTVLRQWIGPLRMAFGDDRLDAVRPKGDRLSAT